MSSLTRFWKPEVGDQTVLPDRSLSIGQKFVKNAKNNPSWRVFENLKFAVNQIGHKTKIGGKCQNETILSDYQTLFKG